MIELSTRGTQGDPTRTVSSAQKLTSRLTVETGSKPGRPTWSSVSDTTPLDCPAP